MGRRSVKELFSAGALQDSGVGLPLIEIAGDRRVLVERHTGVLGYDDRKVTVRLSFGMLQVCGCGLKIVHMTKAQLVISGQIQTVVLQRG